MGERIDNPDGRARKHSRLLDTAGKRFLFIVSVAVVGCVLIVWISQALITRRVTESREKIMMQIANEGIASSLEQEYMTLLQFSQMMRTTESIGKPFYAFLNAETYTERYRSFEQMESNLTTAMFSAGCEFAVYYDTGSGHNYLNGLQFEKKGFAPMDGNVAVRSINEITFQAIHPTQSRISGKDVISLCRNDVVPGHPEIVAYVEIPVSVSELFQRFREEDEMEYQFIEVDEAGVVRYSSDSGIPVGEVLRGVTDAVVEAGGGSAGPGSGRNGTDPFGRSGGYVWSKMETDLGITGYLLIPEESFSRGVSEQLRSALWAAVAALILILMTAVLLQQLIVKKNTVMLREIERVREGDLSRVTERTGLSDYDNMLEQFDSMIGQIRDLLDEVKEKERRRGEAEKELLYYQINPHFLLNTLNSAYWQTRTGQTETIGQDLSQLIRILRYSLGKEQEPPTLWKELEILRLYLELQSRRQPFTYELDVEDGEYLSMPIPRLLIQPIVENSLQHGMDEDGHLSVSVGRADGRVRICVRDDGIGMSPEKISEITDTMEAPAGSRNIGIRYVHTVLGALYGTDAEMKIESEEGKGTTVTILLPEAGTGEND